MIILDTNVISETMKREPDCRVLSWLDAQAPQTLYLSSITIAELLFGVSVIPLSKRRDQLVSKIDQLIQLFENRILSFDLDAARSYSQLALRARTEGLGFPTPDAYIAGIAGSKRLMVASRDTGPYTSVGLPVINPWETPC
jgi:hypothetical protein